MAWFALELGPAPAPAPAPDPAPGPAPGPGISRRTGSVEVPAVSGVILG